MTRWGGFNAQLRHFLIHLHTDEPWGRSPCSYFSPHLSLKGLGVSATWHGESAPTNSPKPRRVTLPRRPGWNFYISARNPGIKQPICVGSWAENCSKEPQQPFKALGLCYCGLNILMWRKSAPCGTFLLHVVPAPPLHHMQYWPVIKTTSKIFKKCLWLKTHFPP